MLKEPMFYEPEQCIIWLLIGYYAKIDDIADAQSFHRFYRQFINSGLVSKVNGGIRVPFYQSQFMP